MSTGDWLPATERASGVCNLGGVSWSSGGPCVFTRLIQVQFGLCWDSAQHRDDGAHHLPCEKRVQHRDNGGCSSRPGPEVTQLSSVCLWCLLSCHSPTRAQDECPGACKSEEDFKRAPGLSAASHLMWVDKILRISTATYKGAPLPHTVLQAGEPGVGLRPLAPQEAPAAVSPNSSLPPVNVGGDSLLCISPCPPVSTWLFLCILNFCSAGLQMVSKLTGLYISCNRSGHGGR